MLNHSKNHRTRGSNDSELLKETEERKGLKEVVLHFLKPSYLSKLNKDIPRVSPYPYVEKNGKYIIPKYSLNCYVNEVHRVLWLMESRIRSRMVANRCKNVTKKSHLYVDCDLNTFFLLINRMKNDVKPDEVKKKECTHVNQVLRTKQNVYSFAWNGVNNAVLPPLMNKYWYYDAKLDYLNRQWRFVCYKLCLEYHDLEKRIYLIFDYHLYMYDNSNKRWMIK